MKGKPEGGNNPLTPLISGADTLVPPFCKGGLGGIFKESRKDK